MKELDKGQFTHFKSLTFSVPITYQFRTIAKKFSSQQACREKEEQIYRNTLAVLAVDFYCQCMGIETELETSDSWNPVMQILGDPADLYLKKVGKVECRAVLPNWEAVEVPPEVWRHRIGYIPIQLSPCLKEATLVGFLEKVESEDVPLPEWRSLDRFLEHISRIQPKQNLSQWFHNLFDAGWDTVEKVESLLKQPLFAFRGRTLENNVIGAKVLQLEPEQESLVLVVGARPTGREEMDISVNLYPVDPQLYLPKDVQVTILDENEDAVMEAIAKNSHNLQLDFSGERGESFSIQVQLGNANLREGFVI